MSQSLLLLVLGGLVASALLIAVLSLVVFRETQRSLAFDRRLGVPRALVPGHPAPSSERRSGSGAGRGAGFTLVRVVSMLAPVGAAERGKLTRLLRGAGFGQPDALSYFLAAKIGVGAVAGAGAAYVAANSEVAGQYVAVHLIAAFVGFVIGGLLPEYALRVLAARRIRRMAAALPDALDLMVMCLESGLTFERGLATVAEELMPIEPALAEEFRLIEAELRLGSNRRAVLEEFRLRTDVEGLKDLAMTLLQSERYGTPLTQSMKNIAQAERDQREARITAQAERLPVLLTLPMLLLVMPGTVCLVAGPAFLSATRALGNLGGGG